MEDIFDFSMERKVPYEEIKVVLSNFFRDKFEVSEMDFSKDLDVKKVLIKLIHYSTGFKSLCEVFLPEEMSFLTKLRLLGIVAMSIDCEVAIGNESEDDSEYIIVDESGNFYKDNSSYFDNDSEEILFFTKEFRTGPFSIDQV